MIKVKEVLSVLHVERAMKRGFDIVLVNNSDEERGERQTLVFVLLRALIESVRQAGWQEINAFLEADYFYFDIKDLRGMRQIPCFEACLKAEYVRSILEELLVPNGGPFEFYMEWA